MHEHRTVRSAIAPADTKLVAQQRAVVIALAIVATAVKLRLAATTQGTNDVVHWLDFSHAVHKLGPIGIYSTNFHGPYNHPPLIGWLLVAVNAAVAHGGPSFRFLIRAPACVADIVTAVLVFELARVRGSLTAATWAAAVAATSPVLFVISGFHGNTDPVFVMFALLAAYLVVHDRPALAGIAAATAISIKLVPVVALVVIAAAVIRHRRRIIAITLGCTAVLATLWLPVALHHQWPGFTRNVLAYKGVQPESTRWGIVDIARHTHHEGLVDWLVGPGRFLALAVAAIVPALLVVRRRNAVGSCVALSLALFLLLTTAFGTQYLAWAAAAVLLLDFWAGVIYNLAAGALLIVTYTHWTNGFPWNYAPAQQLTPTQEHLGGLAWAVLCVCCILGIRRIWQWPAAANVDVTPGEELSQAPAVAA